LNVNGSGVTKILDVRTTDPERSAFDSARSRAVLIASAIRPRHRFCSRCSAARPPRGRSRRRAATCGRKQSEAFEMDMDISTIDGSCHCGTVRFRVRLTNGLHTARRCTCSYCRIRGAIAVSADLGGVDILSGADALSLYKFNTGTARHFFCSKCGIYTHHQRRSILINTASMLLAYRA